MIQRIQMALIEYDKAIRRIISFLNYNIPIDYFDRKLQMNGVNLHIFTLNDLEQIEYQLIGSHKSFHSILEWFLTLKKIKSDKIIAQTSVAPAAA